MVIVMGALLYLTNATEVRTVTVGDHVVLQQERSLLDDEWTTVTDKWN